MAQHDKTQMAVMPAPKGFPINQDELQALDARMTKVLKLISDAYQEATDALSPLAQVDAVIGRNATQAQLKLEEASMWLSTVIPRVAEHVQRMQDAMKTRG